MLQLHSLFPCSLHPHSFTPFPFVWLGSARWLGLRIIIAHSACALIGHCNLHHLLYAIVALFVSFRDKKTSRLRRPSGKFASLFLPPLLIYFSSAMPENLNTYDDPYSPRHRPRPSLVTSASGMADSTISFNTYATGITEGSLCLSQFPPPPMTIPASPITERSLSSPAQSTFTVAAAASTSSRVEQAYPSPARSTFTVTAPAPVSFVSRVPSLSSDQGSSQNRVCPHPHRARSPSCERHLSTPHAPFPFPSLHRPLQQ